MSMFSKIKDYFKGYKIGNFKKNWNSARSDPYAQAKFNYKFTRVLIVLLMLFIGFIILKLAMNVKGGSTMMSLVLKGVMIVVGIILLNKIYFSTLNPMKKILDHYEADPETQTSKYVDVNKEVDEIIDKFDNKEKVGAKV